MRPGTQDSAFPRTLTNQEKLGQVIYFLYMGLIIYCQHWKWGSFGTHIPTMLYIGSYPPLPGELVSNTWKLFKMEHMWRLAKDNLEYAIMQCVNTVSPTDCWCYFKHVGYLSIWVIRWPMYWLLPCYGQIQQMTNWWQFFLIFPRK